MRKEKMLMVCVFTKHGCEKVQIEDGGSRYMNYVYGIFTDQIDSGQLKYTP